MRATIGLIMAGGRGSRMGALTDAQHKCCLPVKGRPIVRHIIDRMHEAGISDIRIACGYQAESVKAIAKADAMYFVEKEPMGTAAAIGQIDTPHPIVVWNGDVLMRTPLVKILDAHRDDATIVAMKYEYQIPWGVVETDYYTERKKGRLVAMGVYEKPREYRMCAIGVYVINPTMVTPRAKLDMPDMLNAMIARGKTVNVYDQGTDWIGIDTPQDLERANELAWL